jgi:hypothetical protein
MSINISGVSNNQAYSTWMERTRQICSILTSNTVTADASTDGSVTVGNTQHQGIMSISTAGIKTLRGGNVSVTDVLLITSNVNVKSSTNTTIWAITSNSSLANLSLSPDNISINPGSNTYIAGQVLNISSTAFNINSGTTTANTILVQTGNTSIKANVTVTMLSAVSNSTTSTVTVGSSNLVVSAANTNFTANINISGLLKVTGNTTVNSLTVSGNLTVGNVTFSSNISVPSITSTGTLTANLSTHSGNATFGTTLVVDTTNGRVGFNTSNNDPSSVITVNGTVTATTFRYPDGSTVPLASGFTSIQQANSSVAVNGTGQIILTVNNSAVAILDSGANSANFGTMAFRANSFVAANGMSSPTINVGTISTNSVTTNSISQRIATTVAVPNTSVLTIDSLPVASIRAADWTVEIEDSSTLSYQMSKLMAIHDGSTTQTTEFAIVTTNNIVGVLTTDISGGNMRLRLSPNTAPLVVKLVRNTITV